MKLYFIQCEDRRTSCRARRAETAPGWPSFNFYTDVNDPVYSPREDQKTSFGSPNRSGYYHIYHYSYDGKLINAVTKGDWDLIKVTGINPDSRDPSIIFLREASPLEQQLYSVRYDGSDKLIWNSTFMTSICRAILLIISMNTVMYIRRRRWECTIPGENWSSSWKTAMASLFISKRTYSPQTMFRFQNVGWSRHRWIYDQAFSFRFYKKISRGDDRLWRAGITRCFQ